MIEQQPVETYQTFLQTKQVRVQPVGMEIPLTDLHSRLFPFQRALVQWALRKGRAALFAECGTGKTGMQLEWARLVHEHSGGDVLILAPLAVASQTIAEGVKLDIVVHPCRSQADVRPGLNIANYEMLAHFDTSHFTGIVLDESSILKSYMGKTKRALVDAFARTPYRLCCTATPAPNDVMEIGNHSEFLVASWAISLRRPSDLGYSDDGFSLPELQMTRHYVETDVTIGVEDGQLFRAPTMSATNLHKEMRLTAADRAQAVADLVNGSEETWVIWCNTNYEQEELEKHFGDRAFSVYGSLSSVEKERRVLGWLHGERSILISKPSICGYGLNFQHCHHTAFVGLSYSFEDFYQAVRRLYRFGQKQPVDVVIVATETESPLVIALERKMRAHMQMSDAMNTGHTALRGDLTLTKYDPQVPMIIPDWMVSHAC